MLILELESASYSPVIADMADLVEESMANIEEAHWFMAVAIRDILEEDCKANIMDTHYFGSLYFHYKNHSPKEFYLEKIIQQVDTLFRCCQKFMPYSIYLLIFILRL